jgi:hypothetical protein
MAKEKNIQVLAENFIEKRDDWIDGFIGLREQYLQWKGV